MHASISGLAEYLAEDDAHALGQARALIKALGWACELNSAHLAPEPLCDAEELLDIMPRH